MLPEKPYRDSKGNKIIRLDADFVRELEGGDCRYISERTQQIALALLEYQRWKTRWYSAGVIDQDEIDAWVDSAAHELMDQDPDCLSECFDFGPEVDAVAFTPQNPYADPDFTPTGYAAPPFTVVKPTDIGLIALGLQVGDVITDLTRFPTGSLPTIIPPTGFARFRVTFTGNEIELHLLQIPGGGIVTISYDDDPLTLATLDLSKDIFSLPVETVTVVTHQIEFATTAEHHVDVTFVPWVNDELPFLTYGGGIRSFTVCGTFGGTLMDVRQNEESPCTLEKTIDGDIWVPFANLRLCPPLMRFDPATGKYKYSTDGIDFYDFPDGPWTEPLYPEFHDPAPRGETGEENQRCAAAANAENVIHAVFNETADKINITGNTATNVASGVALLISTLLFIPVFGWIFLVPVLGAAIAASVVFNRSDYTSGVAETLRCILYCNSTVSGGVVSFNFAAVKSDVEAEGGLPWGPLAYILDIISAEGLDVAGGTTGVSDPGCDCPDCPEGEWCYIWNFNTAGDTLGWQADQAACAMANWYPPIPAFIAVNYCGGQPIVTRIKPSLGIGDADTVLTHVEVYASANGGLLGQSWELVQRDVPTSYTTQAGLSWQGGLLAAPVNGPLYPNIGAVGSGGGGLEIYAVRLRGTGTPPSGGSNC